MNGDYSIDITDYIEYIKSISSLAEKMQIGTEEQKLEAAEKLLEMLPIPKDIKVEYE